MKTFAAILMAFIMFVLSVTSFAQTPANIQYKTETLRDRMEIYLKLEKSLSKELKEMETKSTLIADQNGYNFHRMGEENLKNYIEARKDYYVTKQAMVDELSRIYYSGYAAKDDTVEEELKRALVNFEKNCSLIAKIKDDCTNPHDQLVFQAIYLDTRIESITAIESGLLNVINTALQQEEEDLNKAYRL